MLHDLLTHNQLLLLTLTPLLRTGSLPEEAARNTFQTGRASDPGVHLHWEPEGGCGLEEGGQAHLGILSIQYEDHT